MFSSPNSSGLFLPQNQTYNPDLAIEKLDMGNLMKNSHYRDLFGRWGQATQQIMQNAEYQQGLFQQISALQAEVATLRAANLRYELLGLE